MVKLKYNLNHKISLLPRGIYIEDIITLLEKHGISRDMFYRDRKIEAGSDQSIPSDRLDAYALVLGCTADDLKNYQVKGKSILEVHNKSKIKTNLK